MSNIHTQRQYCHKNTLIMTKSKLEHWRSFDLMGIESALFWLDHAQCRYTKSRDINTKTKPLNVHIRVNNMKNPRPCRLHINTLIRSSDGGSDFAISYNLKKRNRQCESQLLEAKCIKWARKWKENRKTEFTIHSLKGSVTQKSKSGSKSDSFSNQMMKSCS